MSSLPHGGINLSVLSGVIGVLDKSLGPKMLGDDGGRSQRFTELLAELQHAYEQLDDDKARIAKRNKREAKRVAKEQREEFDEAFRDLGVEGGP
jgi:hypothetical protein